jgi:hypothetical protein
MNRKYLYVRYPEEKRNMTVVTDVVPTEDGRYEVKFAWAFCSNHDQFAKFMGRSIVNDRLAGWSPDAKDHSGVLYVDQKKHRVIKTAVLEFIGQRSNTPTKYVRDIVWELFNSTYEFEQEMALDQ